MARPNNDVERVNAYLPRNAMSIMRILAKQRGTTYSDLIRIAVREFIIRETKQEQKQ